MITRCKHCKNYKDRGIKVHLEWINDRFSFVRYALTLSGHDDYSLSIDRINNDGDYVPGNVRFATRKEQNNNRRPYVRAKIDQQ